MSFIQRHESRMPNKKRIIKDKETRKNEIQFAARKVFFKKGFTAATMGEIAQQAHVAPGTIYRYFENKDDLYSSLSIQRNLAMGVELVQLESDIDQKKIASGRDIIMKFLDIFYRMYQKDPDLALIYANMQSCFIYRLSLQSMEKVNQTGRHNFACMRRIIAKGKEQGLIKLDVSELVLADALWATFLGLIIHEETKKRITGADYVYPMLTGTFSLLADAVSNTANNS